MELCRDAGLSTLRGAPEICWTTALPFRIPLQDLRVEREDFELALRRRGPRRCANLISIPDVSWGDIGGLDAVKQRCRHRRCCRCAIRRC